MKSNKEFSLKFIKYLLKCRFLFDKYIIKREYKNEDSNGSWSLKELKCNNKKPQYFNTELKNKWEKSHKYKERKESRHTNIIMLQSCLRVSYTSPKIMHWITELLIWLYDDNNRENISNLETETENFIKKEVKENYLAPDNYYLGVSTQHIVLNYLDYLFAILNSRYKVCIFSNSYMAYIHIKGQIHIKKLRYLELQF